MELPIPSINSCNLTTWGRLTLAGPTLPSNELPTRPKGKGMEWGVPIQLGSQQAVSGSRDGDDPATKAWDICVAMFYKAGVYLGDYLASPPMCASSVSVFTVSEQRETMWSMRAVLRRSQLTLRDLSFGAIRLTGIRTWGGILT